MEGQILNPWERQPITRDQLADYAEASGDKNLIHLDDNFARAAGLPSVIVHGMISMAYLADYLSKEFPEYSCSRINCRFRKITFPGDRLTCEGKVRKEVDGKWMVALWCRNQNGEVTTEAEAEIVKK